MAKNPVIGQIDAVAANPYIVSIVICLRDGRIRHVSK